MANSVMSIIASSTAHGISRAAGSTSIPLKIMWMLLFLVFLGLFFNNAMTLVNKLSMNGIEKVYELDKVPFLFPDLYFCPSNPYSGSFPFMLSLEEANEVNNEIVRLGKMYDDLFGSNTSGSMHTSLISRAYYIQKSLPVNLVTKYLAQRRSQAVLLSQISTVHTAFNVSMVEFNHPENVICFKVVLTDEERRHMESKMYKLEVQLSTDPYFTDFTYPGHHIKPMVDTDSSEQILYQDWHPTLGIERLKSSGFTVLIVQKGAYPSFAHNARFLLAPGKSYMVTLHMEENAFSHDLHGVNCTKHNPEIAFQDYLTREETLFRYSYSACYYREMTRILMTELDCVFPHYPIVWSMKDAKRCFNMSESSNANMQKLKDRMIDWNNIEATVKDICRVSQPCVHPDYAAAFSFAKWPSVGSSAVSHFARMTVSNESQEAAPATAQLIKIAKSLNSAGNHSAHSEGLFRAYVSEALISVTIVPASTMSAQVLISRSYSVTAFLADTGGLLGLYIGCSLLTVCELFELAYSFVSNLRAKRKKKDQEGDVRENGDETTGAMMEPVELAAV